MSRLLDASGNRLLTPDGKLQLVVPGSTDGCCGCAIKFQIYECSTGTRTTSYVTTSTINVLGGGTIATAGAVFVAVLNYDGWVYTSASDPSDYGYAISNCYYFGPYVDGTDDVTSNVFPVISACTGGYSALVCNGCSLLLMQSLRSTYTVKIEPAVGSTPCANTMMDSNPRTVTYTNSMGATLAAFQAANPNYDLEGATFYVPTYPAPPYTGGTTDAGWLYLELDPNNPYLGGGTYGGIRFIQVFCVGAADSEGNGVGYIVNSSWFSAAGYSSSLKAVANDRAGPPGGPSETTYSIDTWSTFVENDAVDPTVIVSF